MKLGLSLTAVFVLVVGCSSSNSSTSSPDLGATQKIEVPSSTTSPATADSKPAQIPTTQPTPREKPEGYKTVMAGHSFFEPVATKLKGQAFRAGYLGHEQEYVFGGGSDGSPEGLWRIDDTREQIQELLSQGDVDLLGLTYHYADPDLDGYRLWIDEALRHNPQTAFFIGMPWLPEPQTMNAGVYANEWQRLYDTAITPMIADLRSEYPFTVIFGIPYGKASVKLYELYELGLLPGVQNFVGGLGTSLFTDNFGHGGDIVHELASLVWLQAIYCVDLTSSSYNYWSPFEIDLRPVAKSISSEQNPADANPLCAAA